jgi:hypothetical protein
MCEPATLTIIAVSAAVAAAGVSAYGQYQQGEYQKAVADENAKMQEQSAALASQRGAVAAGVQRMKSSQEIGAARAAAGGSGIELTSGTTLDAISDARMLSELDAQTITNNAAREAWGYKAGAMNAIAQGQAAQMAGRYGAAATLIGGAAQAASMGASYKSAQIGPRGGTSGGTTGGTLV